jgi:hypothetical protein
MYHSLMLVMLFVVFVTTGCATKVTLGPISDDLKPTAQLSGKVHVMPVVDSARLVQYGNSYFSTVSGNPAEVKSPYISETHPVSMIEKSITNCLTQSGLTVTSGPKAPDDADLVLNSTAKYLYVDDTDRNTLFHVGIALATGLITSSSNPKSTLIMANQIEDRKSAAKSAAIFSGREEAMLYALKSGGAERAFRLVQEDYCGWLQQKLSQFKTDPVTADRVNKKEIAALVRQKK